MSSIAMSNETDLDWLARVLHKWPDGDGITMLGRGCSFFDTGFGRVVHVYAVDGSDYTTIKEKDWLARRAELQNKPSWDAVPNLANWLTQDAAGTWLWHSSGPECRNGMWVHSTTKGYAAKGSVLGDWRDTLEKRPEEFKQFTSIEDNQEQVMTQQKDMKQDNGWFERGDLPPVGTVCEVLWNEGRMEYLRTKVFGVNEHGQPIHRFDEGPNKFEYQADPLVTILGTRVFRPVRTERDVLLSIIVEEMNRYDTDGKLADAILAAGFSLRDK